MDMSETIPAKARCIRYLFLVNLSEAETIPALFRDNFNDICEDIILNNGDTEFQTPDNFIEAFIEGSAAAKEQAAAAITLAPIDLMYFFEFRKIIKVGGIASPYTIIEWLGVRTLHALTPII